MTKNLQMWVACVVGAFATAALWAALINVPATAQVTNPAPNQPAVDQTTPADQNRLHDGQLSTRADRAMTDRQACKASDIIGMEVRAASDDK